MKVVNIRIEFPDEEWTSFRSVLEESEIHSILSTGAAGGLRGMIKLMVNNKLKNEKND